MLGSRLPEAAEEGVWRRALAILQVEDKTLLALTWNNLGWGGRRAARIVRMGAPDLDPFDSHETLLELESPEADILIRTTEESLRLMGGNRDFSLAERVAGFSLLESWLESLLEGLTGARDSVKSVPVEGVGENPHCPRAGESVPTANPEAQPPTNGESNQCLLSSISRVS